MGGTKNSTKQAKKANSPSTTNKLQRAKKTTKSPMKISFSSGPRPFLVNVLQMKQGVVAAFVSKCDNVHDEGFIAPILSFLENSHAKGSIEIDLACYRRGSDGRNVEMKSKPSQSSGPYHQFVKVFGEVDENTSENARSWAETLATQFEDWAKESYKYPKPFRFGENYTEMDTNGELPSPDKYLLNEDVMKVMDVSYPTTEYSRKEQSENLAEDYFGTNSTTKEAVHFILNYPVES